MNEEVKPSSTDEVNTTTAEEFITNQLLPQETRGAIGLFRTVLQSIGELSERVAALEEKCK